MRPPSSRNKLITRPAPLVTPIIDSKHTPDFHTPRSQTSDSLFAESYEAGAAAAASSSPVKSSSSKASNSDQQNQKEFKLKAMSSTGSSKNKRPKSNKVKMEPGNGKTSKSKPITNERLHKIAAQLAKDAREKQNLVNPIENETTGVTGEDADADDETVGEQFHSVMNSGTFNLAVKKESSNDRDEEADDDDENENVTPKNEPVS
jgi:hypothetical protein